MGSDDRRTPLNQIRDLLRATELTEAEASYLRGLVDARVRLPRGRADYDQYGTVSNQYDSKFGEAEPHGRD